MLSKRARLFLWIFTGLFGGLLLTFVFGIFFPDHFPSWLGTTAVYQTDGSLLAAPKTLWDLAALLIIPTVLSLGVLFFNRAEQEIENNKVEENTQETTLQTYLDRMSVLMTEKGLVTSEKQDPVRIVARTQTRTTIYRLSGGRKGLVIRFLKEAGLIDVGDTIIKMAGLDLSRIQLKRAILNNSNFSHANFMQAILERAQFQNTQCFKTNFTGANLNHADFRGASLSRAIFIHCDAHGSNFSAADLIKTDFSSANLQNTSFLNAKLNGSDFRSADLRGARLDKTDLNGAKLINAIYDEFTQWPEGFDPQSAGAILKK